MLRKNCTGAAKEVAAFRHDGPVNSLGPIARIRALYSGPLGSIVHICVKKIHHVCIRLPRKPFAYKRK